MASGSRVVGIALAVVIAAVMLSPLIDTVQSNSGTISVTNESVVAAHDEYVELDGYNIVSNSETVYNASGNVQTAGSDYELAEENGSIKALSGGNIADGESIKVSYDYEATSSTAATIIDLLPLFVGLLIMATIGRYVSQATG